jgi:hypothetical protein
MTDSGRRGLASSSLRFEARTKPVHAPFEARSLRAARGKRAQARSNPRATGCRRQGRNTGRWNAAGTRFPSPFHRGTHRPHRVHFVAQGLLRGTRALRRAPRNDGLRSAWTRFLLPPIRSTNETSSCSVRSTVIASGAQETRASAKQSPGNGVQTTRKEHRAMERSRNTVPVSVPSLPASGSAVRTS